ncbi:MAG: tRNA pseudouridine(55) synthase TruB [Armatimonadota bacterium]|nr:tRNA pseudouridine(55) synthase TruB [Armatimonadota bacterium]MCX7777440.1 tRNA pseudouridine(55) synthase TruB [Armatimonadota bacterium]MDW8025109.1 tRNA pseudouridine(55) synthase TruB [Armatimonadota bacterium]
MRTMDGAGERNGKFEGVLPVIKPPGMTSHDVVDFMRNLLRMQRIGHAGTLDVHASGVLVICIGRATRITNFIIDCDKVYRGEMVLGIRTTTQDSEGEVVSVSSTEQVCEEAVRSVFKRFCGVISQTPPMLSALRHHGKRLYELAREGKVIERKMRHVTVKRLELLKFYDEEPKRVLFEVECSRGTYVRTLVADIGDALGCGAYLSFLVRTAVGPFSVNDCLTLEEVQKYHANGNLREFILSIDQALCFLPALPLTHIEARRAINGAVTSVRAIDILPNITVGNLVRLYAPGGKFIAVARVIMGKHGLVCKPECVFPAR